MQQLPVIVSIAAKLGNIAGLSLQDNKIDMADMVYLPNAVMLFPMFAQVDWAKAKEEINGFSSGDATMLVELFKKEFDIPQEIEVKIERVLDISVRVIDLAMDLIELFKK